MRIVFAGTPDFSVPALDALIRYGHQVIGVYTQPDRAAGRGRRLTASPVKRCAQAAQIPVLQPQSLRDPSEHSRLAGLRPDMMVVVAYGLILPPAVLAVPPLGCWNIHASLLPRWRGAAPIQRAILAGDEQTGVTIMQMDQGLDTGAVLARRATPIGSEETAGTLHERLATLGAELLLQCLGRSSELTPEAQAGSGVSYAAKISKQEAWLDWRREAVALERQVRAFDPWPVALTALSGERLRVWKARVRQNSTGAPVGEILAAGPAGIDVASGAGVLRLEQVQRPGGRRLAVADFLNAHRGLRPGECFEPPPGQ